MASENDIKIAVLEEQIRGLREQNKAQFDAIRVDLGALSTKMEGVLTFMNQNKGGMKVILACGGVAGAIGAGVTKLIAVMGALH